MSVFFEPQPGDPARANAAGDDSAGPDATGTATSGKPAPRRRRTVWILLAAVTVVLLGSLVAGAVYVTTIAGSVSQNLQRRDLMPPSDGPIAPGEAPRPARKAESKAINYVLIGSDSRTATEVGRSDVLMVLHLSGDRRKAYAVSFPRDLWVRIPSRGMHKINAAYAFGGTKLTVRTLEDLLDTRMDHVAQIDFEGFIGLTEDLDGVTIDNPHPSVSNGYNFPVGKITIRGPEALAYVRERKQLPRGDLDRAERQRLVLQAIVAKGLSRDTITNPQKFLAFTAGTAKHVTVDAQLGDAELRDTALSLRMTPRDLELLQAPITGFGTSSDGQSIALVDKDKLAELATAIRDDKMASYLEMYPNG